MKCTNYKKKYQLANMRIAHAIDSIKPNTNHKHITQMRTQNLDAHCNIAHNGPS